MKIIYTLEKVIFEQDRINKLPEANQVICIKANSLIEEK